VEQETMELITRQKSKKNGYLRQNTTEEGKSLSRVIIYRREKWF
jgi:hypothetical protein